MSSLTTKRNLLNLKEFKNSMFLDNSESYLVVVQIINQKEETLLLANGKLTFQEALIKNVYFCNSDEGFPQKLKEKCLNFPLAIKRPNEFDTKVDPKLILVRSVKLVDKCIFFSLEHGVAFNRSRETSEEVPITSLIINADLLIEKLKFKNLSSFLMALMDNSSLNAKIVTSGKSVRESMINLEPVPLSLLSPFEIEQNSDIIYHGLLDNWKLDSKGWHK